jgi:hypothetical protein
MRLIDIVESMAECNNLEELIALWVQSRTAWRERFSRREFRLLQITGMKIGRRLLRMGKVNG